MFDIIISYKATLRADMYTNFSTAYTIYIAIKSTVYATTFEIDKHMWCQTSINETLQKAAAHVQ